jgi:hypothetical protein
VSLADTAQALIKKNGRVVSILTTTTALSDPAKPWGSVGDTKTTTSVSAYGAFFNESARDLEARLSAVSRLVLSPVETNMSLVYIAAKGLTVVPKTSDKLVDPSGPTGSRTLEIKQVELIRPSTEAILYILKVEN